MPEPQHPAARPPASRPWHAWLLGGLVCALGLVLFSRQLGFSWHFHADEGGKIDQIVSGDRNFNHPLLMLHLVEAGARLQGLGPDDRHGVVMTGRWVSVALTAAACACLAVAVALAAGPLWGWLAGILLLAHPSLFTYAHFFKEDPVLLAGLSLAALGLSLVARNRDRAGRAGWIVLGLGLGMAAGGKYVGLLWWPFLLAAAAWAARSGRDSASAPRPPIPWRRLALAGGIALLAILLIEIPAFRQGPRLGAAVASEIDKALGPDSRGSGRSGSPVEFVSRLRRNPAAASLGLAALVASVGMLVRRPRPWPWILTAASLWTYFLVLSFSTKDADRYLLPWYAGVTALAAGTVGGWLGRLDPRSSLRRAGAPAAVVLALAAAGFLAADQQDVRRSLGNFDQRLETIEFIRQNLPPEAMIFYGSRVGLVDPAYPQQYPAEVKPLPQRVRFVSDPWLFGSVEGLRAAGAGYYVASDELARVFRVSKMEGKQEFARDFREHTRLIFESSRGQGTFFPMKIQVFALDPGKPPG